MQKMMKGSDGRKEASERVGTQSGVTLGWKAAPHDASITQGDYFHETIYLQMMLLLLVMEHSVGRRRWWGLHGRKEGVSI